MAQVPRETIDSIRERVDLVAVISEVVTLKKKGGNWKGLCPFHDEKTPSFNVLPDKGFYHCFGCQEGGDVFSFVQKTRGISFFEAIKELGELVGIQVETRELSVDERKRIRVRADLFDVGDLACGYFESVLNTKPEGKVAREYLEKRGITTDTIAKYRLGYAPDTWDGLLNFLHREGVDSQQAIAAGLARPRRTGRGAYDLFRGRVMIPIQDQRGRVVAFGGRHLVAADAKEQGGDIPKYVNSPETDIYKKSNVLYGLSQARSMIQRRDRALVVEGYFDVLSLHQAGFGEAIATCGTALTREHIRLLRRLTDTVVALFDSDDAGMDAAEKSLDLFLSAGIEPRRLDLGESKDPDEFVLAHGPEAFAGLLEGSEPLFEMVLRRAVKRNGLTPGGRQKCLAELAPKLRLFPSGSRSVVEARVAGALGVHEEAVREQVGRSGRDRAMPQRPMGESAPRWKGNPDLNHLLWLLIHYPQQVASHVAEVDPDVVSARPSVRRAIGLLISGEDFHQVIEKISDADLARVMRAAAAIEGLYDNKNADSAVRQILAHLKLNRVRAAISANENELSTCVSAVAESRYFELLRRRQTLQLEKDALTKQRIASSSSGIPDIKDG